MGYLHIYLFIKSYVHITQYESYISNLLYLHFNNKKNKTKKQNYLPYMWGALKNKYYEYVE